MFRGENAFVDGGWIALKGFDCAPPGCSFSIAGRCFEYRMVFLQIMKVGCFFALVLWMMIDKGTTSRAFLEKKFFFFFLFLAVFDIIYIHLNQISFLYHIKTYDVTMFYNSFLHQVYIHLYQNMILLQLTYSVNRVMVLVL